MAFLSLLLTTSAARSLTHDPTTTKDGFLWTPHSSTHGLLTDAVTASTPNTSNTYDVVVIGAGFAGLTAARDLSSAGGEMRVLLVEARDRIGGRTYTARALDDHYEMGGTWMHWFQANVYGEVTRYELQGQLRTSRASAPVPVLEEIARQFFTIDNHTAQQLVPWPLDPLRAPVNNGTDLLEKYSNLTVRERLDQLQGFAPEALRAFEIQWNLLGDLDPAELAWTEALGSYASAGFSMFGVEQVAGIYRLAGEGTTGLARRMLHSGKADRLFGATVQKIEQDGEGVRVYMRDGRVVMARYVINTVPLNVAGSIVYEPPLPALVQEAYRVGQQNRNYKLNLRLATPRPELLGFQLWDDHRALSAAFTEQRDDLYSPNVTASGINGVAFGYRGRFPSGVEDSRFVLSALSEIFGESVTGEGGEGSVQLAGYLAHDWVADPYANGTWCSLGPGQAERYLAALQQKQGRVYMASADWADGWRGYIDGAIEQGARAARDVLQARADDEHRGSTVKQVSEGMVGDGVVHLFRSGRQSGLRSR